MTWESIQAQSPNPGQQATYVIDYEETERKGPYTAPGETAMCLSKNSKHYNRSAAGIQIVLSKNNKLILRYNRQIFNALFDKNKGGLDSQEIADSASMRLRNGAISKN